MKLVIRTENSEMTRSVKNRIWQADMNAVFDKEGNPVTFWVTTKLSVESIERIEGVQDVIVSGDQP